MLTRLHDAFGAAFNWLVVGTLCGLIPFLLLVVLVNVVHLLPKRIFPTFN